MIAECSLCFSNIVNRCVSAFCVIRNFSEFLLLSVTGIISSDFVVSAVVFMVIVLFVVLLFFSARALFFLTGFVRFRGVVFVLIACAFLHVIVDVILFVFNVPNIFSIL